MRAVFGAVRQVARLFFDDGCLAIGVLLILDVTATLRYAGLLVGADAIALLVGGVVVALLENVTRTARVSRAGAPPAIAAAASADRH